MTIIERVRRFAVSARVTGECAENVTAETITQLTAFKNLVRTVTADNCKEFARLEEIATQLNRKFYFANFYRSWERGCNENTNGSLWQFFPKITDFKRVKTVQLIAVLCELNDRPRKILASRFRANLMQIEVVALAA